MTIIQETYVSYLKKYQSHFQIQYIFKKIMKTTQQKKIYWQKQGVDMLCGVHTINSLLQGPFFNQITLANIALELDKKQKELMHEQGMTKDFLKYMQQESGNVAMSGNYSIQVLVQALKEHHLEMIPITTISKSEDLTKKIGFICNSQAHWFTIRKINNVWYNLNSTNKRLPEIISDFYLSAFLHSVQESGYQIFSVEGVYPESNQDLFEQYNENQEWYDAKRIEKYHEKRVKRKGYKPNISGAGDDKEMERAIAASLGKKYEEEKSSGQDSDWDKPEGKKEVKAFTGNSISLGGSENVDYDKFLYTQDDFELIFSIRSSLDEAFKDQPKSGISVAFRYPNGKKQRRYFAEDTLIYTLYDYIWRNRDPSSHFYLVNSESKQKLLDLNIPINILATDGDITLFVTDM